VPTQPSPQVFKSSITFRETAPVSADNTSQADSIGRFVWNSATPAEAMLLYIIITFKQILHLIA